MASLRTLLHEFIHKDFHETVAKMTIIDAFLFLIVHSIDKLGIWSRLPVFLGLLYLAIRRHLHEEYNLFNVGRSPVGVRFNPQDFPFRTADGEFNDPFNEGTGSHGTFFGRNILPADQDDKIELTAPREVANQCPLKSFKFYKTKEVPTGFYEIKTGAINIRTPWWDGSVIYGSNAETLQKLRTFKDGKLKISSDGLLLHDQDGIAVSGDVRNSWIGISTLQALFIKEHNAVCDTLKMKERKREKNIPEGFGRTGGGAPHRGEEDRSTGEGWPVAAGSRTAVHSVQYGLLGKKFKDTFGHVGGGILGGLVGLKKPINHGVPYSLTEEFVSVYRMHSLLPDYLDLRDISATPGPNKSPPLNEKVPMPNLIGIKGEKALAEIGFAKQIVSMGPPSLRGPRALELSNVAKRHYTTRLYRDRERKVARYNEFRRGLLLIPISKWKDLTDDDEVVQVLEEVYGHDVEELDLLVGLMAEKKIKGFAISETAFIIFVLMASRRLEADRFFTSNFNEETYTKKGLEWVNKTESLKDVIGRHYPELVKKWMNSTSAFSVWDSAPNSHNPIPLYLRVPQ
uniref:Uncharacterized protein n=1 Tax=Fagus sylvatica TaxID=28930 RepID=A0A2N9ELS2_FAGSY